MQRAIILMLDSLGVGYSNDAEQYGDKGANTLGHIIKEFPNIKIDNLKKLGLLNILSKSSKEFKEIQGIELPNSYWGFAKEISRGKDTPSGHWELMGCPVEFDWGYFRDEKEPFPKELLDKIFKEAKIEGSIGNCIGSGTDIIKNFGEIHLKTKQPIFYTSADSVFQIAMHEDFGLQNLYKLCEIARKELYQYNIGRVIARPFVGTNKDNFKRTGNRRDYSIAPHSKTLLDVMVENQGKVVAIGKIADIFANKGITKYVKSATLENLFNDTLKQMEGNKDYSIIFTNFVDFDSEYGHRRDVLGYKNAIEYFDSRLGEIFNFLGEEDLLVIIADHGCDPTWKGSDHTREHIPIIFYNTNFESKYIGKRESFCDVGQSIASFLKLPNLKMGKSFI